MIVFSIGCNQKTEKSTPNTHPSSQVDTIATDAAEAILNNEQILKDSTIQKTYSYLELKEELIEEQNNLEKHNMHIEKYLRSSIALYKNEKYAAYSDLQEIQGNIPKNFDQFGFKHGIEKLNPILNNDSIPEIFKFNISKGICRKYTTSAKLDSALIYFELIKNLYPEIQDRCIDNSFPCVANTYGFLDSLKKENISTDEFLFEEAKSRQKMIECSCWFGESMYNLSIVSDKYQELLREYPNSEYADDAEYWMIDNRYFYVDEQGGYPISEIPEIKKFINKYPNSNCIPDLITSIAYSYTIDKNIENYNEAIKLLKNLKVDYQLDSLQTVSVEQTLYRYLHEINELIYDFTILPSKKQYKIGEDIEVTVILKNRSSISRNVKLFQNDSYFSFGIYPAKMVPFTPADRSDTITKEIEMLPNVPLQQNITLNTLTRHWDGDKLGKFNIDEEGVYNVSCYSKENKLKSKYVKIQIVN